MAHQDIKTCQDQIRPSLTSLCCHAGGESTSSDLQIFKKTLWPEASRALTTKLHIKNCTWAWRHPVSPLLAFMHCPNGITREVSLLFHRVAGLMSLTLA